MSNVSVKLYQKASKVRADGTAPIYVRVVANRKSSLRSTGVYVAPRDWNEKRQQVRASHEIAKALNARLADVLHETQEASLGAVSARAVKAAVGGATGSLTAYLQRYIDRLEAQGDRSHWEWRKYRVLLGKVQECFGPEVPWKELDRDALVVFERYLRQTKGNGPNTTLKELSRLHRVVKQAVRDGVLRPADDPFLVYQPPKGQRVERRKLALADVEKIAGLGPEDGVTPGTVEEVTRDAFAFAFYAGGMRFSDVASLKAADVVGDRVSYRMLKTLTVMSIPLPPAAVEIVERYRPSAATRGGFLFPLLTKGDDKDGVHLRRRIGSRNVQVNTALKRLAKKAGIDEDGLSFHVSRHSFADHARRHSDDLYAVSKALGHGNLSTTETYLKSFDQDAVDKLAT
ncbi:MAG TPA: site-specific integrase, partial [Rubricoccaceae bacterium]